MHKTGITTNDRVTRDKRGFSLAETLMVVAILIILMGVGFIALIRWRTTLRQLEFDATAKEIYMAAQNHLSLAESQGLLEDSSIFPGTQDKNYLPVGASGDPLEEVYYFVYGDSTDDPNNKASVLGLMLPFGSIDDTVRIGGSYVICYQHSTGTVLEVFYTADGKLSTGNYATLYSLRGDAHKTDRQKVSVGGKDIIVGYYGGEDGGIPAVKLKAPSVQVKNDDMLTIIVTNPTENTGLKVGGVTFEPDLKLIIEAKNGSTGTMSVDLKKLTHTPGKEGDVYTFVLDDVTAQKGMFSEVAKTGSKTGVQVTGKLDPGCNLSILAWASGNKDVLATVAKSAPVETNSLFASAEMGKDTDSDKYLVKISSYRHLINLSSKPNNVSGFNPTAFSTTRKIKATQTTDLSWASFLESIKDQSGTTDDPSIYYETKNTNAGDYLPVYVNNPNKTLSYTLDYNGNGHRIAGIVVSGGDVSTRPSGVFAWLGSGSAVSNLEVVNASINASAASGALVGQLAGANIENVLVRTTLKSAAISGKTIESSGNGNAGGLVGTMDSGSISKCAAAVHVKSAAGAAGGLVGNAAGGSITSSYSGGHTTNGLYDKTSGKADVISASGNAGGLVGTSSASIDKCYSTCSVSGATEGGLAGSITGGSVSQTYVTGWVNPTASTTPGAFAGSSSVASGASNYYYKIINNVTKTEGGKEVTEPMQPVGSNASSTLAAPFDAMDEGGALTTFYTVYTGGGKSSAQAIPYDEQLAKLYVYNGKAHYAFQCIDAWADLKTPATPTEGTFTAHLTRHYGDWPAPETLVVNTQ